MQHATAEQFLQGSQSPEGSPESPENCPENSTYNQESKPALSANKMRANRLNATKSTGPRTPQGKAYSRRNAIKHGLLADEIVRASPEHKYFLRELREHFKPADIIEDLLVQRIAHCYWNQKLAIRAEIGESRKQQAIAGAVPAECGNPSHGDIFGLWLRSQYDRAARRQQGIHNGGLTDTEERIIRRMRQGSLGAAVVLTFLKRIHAESVKTGVVSQVQRDLLRDSYGREADWLLRDLSDGTENESKHLAKFLDQLDRVIRSLTLRLHSLREAKKLDIQRLSVPDERVSLIHYDAHNSRELYRALGELERLQRRRKGDLVLPPIKVNVTGDR